MSNRRAEKRRQLKAQSKKRQRRIQYRLRDRDWEDQSEPMFSARNVHYEIADRSRGVDAGGIGLIHKMVRKLGLEWLWRLLLEPKRVWRRVVVDAPQFAALAMLELTGLKRYG